MAQITIKLLHERRSNNRRRKVDGRSGKIYLFTWDDQHKAYCFATAKTEEIDDLFNSQGRAFGSYFAPVITVQEEEAKPVDIPPDIALALLKHDIMLPQGREPEHIARALVIAFERGMLAAANPVLDIPRAPARQQHEPAGA